LNDREHSSFLTSDARLREDVNSLSAQIQRFDRQFCERINAMHSVRGFEVLDCETGAILVENAEKVMAEKAQ